MGFNLGFKGLKPDPMSNLLVFSWKTNLPYQTDMFLASDHQYSKHAQHFMLDIQMDVTEEQT